MRGLIGMGICLLVGGTACSPAPTPLPPALLVVPPPTITIDPAASPVSEATLRYMVDERLRGLVDPARQITPPQIGQFAAQSPADADLWLTLADEIPTETGQSMLTPLDVTLWLTVTTDASPAAGWLAGVLAGDAGGVRLALANAGYPDGYGLPVRGLGWQRDQLNGQLQAAGLFVVPADDTPYVLVSTLAPPPAETLIVSRYPLAYRASSRVTVTIGDDQLPHITRAGS